MKKDDATWLRICYVAFACIVAYTTWKAMGSLGIETGWVERYNEWFPLASTAVSIVVGILVTFWLAKNAERHDYFLNSIGELRKVTWPGFLDTRRMTIVVCVVVGIFAAILAVFDLAWAKLLGTMLT